MSLFRLQDNVPSVYVEESRDFQLLCRLKDSLHNGVRYDIKSIINIIDPLKISDSLLGLYATKVGFFSKREIESNTLRYILSAFPYIIKNKGNILGVQYAVASILKAENNPDAIKSVYILEPTVDNDYTLSIYVPVKLYNIQALEEVLKYIVPAGVKQNIETFQFVEDLGTVDFTTREDTILVKAETVNSSSIKGYTTDHSTDIENRLFNSYDTSQVIGYTNAVSDENGGNNG